jgi:tetratricopeptide (TPR) repeat protein
MNEINLDVDGQTVRIDVDAGVVEMHLDGGVVLGAVAEQHLRAGRIDDAIDAFEQARQLTPDNTDIAYGLSAALTAAGRVAEALAEAERGVALHPRDGRHLVNRGVLRAELGDDDDAGADLDQAVAVADNMTDTLFARAEVWYAWQQYEAAIADLHRLTRDAPNHPNAWFVRGLAHVRLGQLADAVVSFGRDIEAGSPGQETYSNRAACHLALGNRPEALEDLDQAVLMRPDDLGVRRRRAKLRWAQQDVSGALADWDTVLAEEPDDRTARHGRAIGRCSTGDLDGSIADFELLVADGDGNAPVWSNYGFALQEAGRHDDARSAYRTALALDPEYDKARNNLDALNA